MLQQYLALQFESALLQLKNEINNYTHKDHVWELRGDIKNSGGTLCLHIVGHLNNFIGAGLGNTGYVRNRDAEFADRNVPTSELMKKVDETMYMVKTTVAGITDEQLFAPYPLNDGKPAKITAERLVHALAHMNYHLGQLNYHRRMLDQPVSLPDDVLRLAKQNVVL